MVILLNKAHYWVLKQHTDSTPQPLFREVLPLNGHSCYFVLLPRSRGNSINYTSVSFTMQIRFPWFTPQCFFPKLFQHHPSATRNSFKQETKTLYNWKPVKPLPTRRNTEEALRFFLLAAATHTTIQMPKWVCNPKMGEVDHKQGALGSFWLEQSTKMPSQHRISLPKVLWKKFKNLQKTPQKPAEAP